MMCNFAYVILHQFKKIYKTLFRIIYLNKHKKIFITLKTYKIIFIKKKELY